MRIDVWFYTAIGLANASVLKPREPQTSAAAVASTWKPKTHNPEFFSLKVDDKCDPGEDASACPFQGYAVRLEDGIVIATPYNKWWDPKLPIFLVDDDTQCYTVSVVVWARSQDLVVDIA
jgi:hypothetical protein